MRNKITQKIEEIRKQREQLMANLNALAGAEQVLQQLLNEMESDDDGKTDNS